MTHDPSRAWTAQELDAAGGVQTEVRFAAAMVAAEARATTLELLPLR